MKKIIAILLSMVLVLGLLAACGAEAASTAEETQAEDTAAQMSEESPSEDASAQDAEAPAAEEEAAAPEDAAADGYTEADLGEGFVFKHGFDLDYPPYSHIDDEGNVGGFDVELAQALCELYGWEYEAVPFNWDAKDAELNAGSCDCIWSGFTLNGREDDYLWSVPYSDNTQMILVNSSSGIKTLADLAGKVVGVQTSTSAYDLLNDEEGQKELADSFASLEVYETYTIAFNDLKAGAVDALAIDVTSGNYLMSGETDYVYLDEPLGSEQYAIGFRMNDIALRDAVNAGLAKLQEEGTIDQIGQNYPDIYDYLTMK